MATLALNKPFSTFGQRNETFSRRQTRRDFDQIVPTIEKKLEYRGSGYLLDSLSQIISNQSLSPEQIAKSQLRAIDEKLSSLNRKYEIAKFEEIKNFLSKNRFLFSLLEEIPNKIYQYFGDSQRLSLKISYEPDFPQSSELWVLILTELSAKDAFPILEKFDEDWWLENLDLTDCKLNVRLEYI